jgi:cell division septum initiation protein DivIVA
MDVAQALRELRATVEKARSMPMSSSAVINRTEVLALIDQLQGRMLDAFAASDEMFSDRDSFLVGSRQEAQRIVGEAQREREELVAETDVYKIARREAEQLRSDAEQEATELRKEIDEYVDQRLANLEISLNKTLEAVARGRNRLQGRSGLGQLGETDDDTPFPFAD